MRKDMHKVVTDRPRHGDKEASSGKRWYNQAVTPRIKRYIKGVVDDLRPKRESMRRKHIVCYEGKNLSDNVKPLERWLDAQAGRHWDDVYSDLVHGLPKGLHNQHIMQHVSYYVNGIPFTSQYWYSNDKVLEPNTDYWRGTLYVNENKILCIAPPTRKKKKQHGASLSTQQRRSAKRRSRKAERALKRMDAEVFLNTLREDKIRREHESNN